MKWEQLEGEESVRCFSQPMGESGIENVYSVSDLVSSSVSVSSRFLKRNSDEASLAYGCELKKETKL